MRDKRALISTSELAALLSDPSLRIYDCTTKTVAPPPGSDVPYVAVPGLPEFEAAHIPGADFLDIQGEFSDQATKLRFMMPPIPRGGVRAAWPGAGHPRGAVQQRHHVDVDALLVGAAVARVRRGSAGRRLREVASPGAAYRER